MSVNRLTIEQFKDYIYNHLPEYYREQDALVGKTLWKYLSIFDDGAFKFVIEDANGILDIIDPIKTPSFLLPHLFKSYGLEIFNGIPEAYQRSMLAIIGTLWKYKGTTTVIRYLTSLIAGVKTTITEEEKTLTVVLDMDFENSEDGSSKLPSRENLVRIIDEFLPFYTIAVIVYSYFYTEYLSLTAKDSDNADFVSFSQSENIGLSFTDDSGSVLKIKDIFFDDYKIIATESDSLLNDQNSVLGSTFILNNYGNSSDKVISNHKSDDGSIGMEDESLSFIVKYETEEANLSIVCTNRDSVKESTIMEQRTPSFNDVSGITNSLNSVLGSTFILNNAGCYDIIKVNGEEHIIFN